MTETGHETVLAAAVGALRAAYPRQDFPDESVELYMRMLDDLPALDVARAIDRLVRTSRFLPSIAEISDVVAELQCQLPTAAEAWTMVTNAGVVLPDAVRESLAAIGGPWTLRHSEKPLVVHAQFLADYEQRRRTAIERAALGQGYVTASSSRVELEYTDAMKPRPVWARWLLRQASATRSTIEQGWDRALPPPTDEEKHDAILVLEHGGGIGGVYRFDGADLLHVEAQRILDDAWHDCERHPGNRCSTPRECPEIGCQL